jgi:septal ring factor EnvC (AmiA/AmiB activator)
LLLAVGVWPAFAWQSSYGDAAKLIVARWLDGILSQPAPLAQASPHDIPRAADPMPPELMQRFQTMASNLANFEQRIEQLTTSQEQAVRDDAALAEQLKAAEQKIRDNAAVADELKAALAPMVRNNADLSKQLKAAQEKLAVLESLRGENYDRKSSRKREPMWLLPKQR